MNPEGEKIQMSNKFTRQIYSIIGAGIVASTAIFGGSTSAFAINGETAPNIIDTPKTIKTDSVVETSARVQTAPTSESEPPSVILQMRSEDGIWKNIDPVSTESTDPQMSPLLLTFFDTFECEVLNNYDHVIATMYFMENPSTPHKADLLCGDENTSYEHILFNHKTQWQDKLDAAEAAGWDPQAWGVDSWDDLMWLTFTNVMSNAGNVESNYTSNKACGWGEFSLVDVLTGQVVYTFAVEGVASMNNDRVITAFPSSRTYCNT